jgi:hypothetical protein
MPIVMKSSDNGFVDATRKIVCFPSHLQPRFETKETLSHNAGGRPLAGWTSSSWPPTGEVKSLAIGPPRDSG